MTRVAGCAEFSPPVFAPHRGLKEARSSWTSTVEGKKKADFVRSPDSALSGGSTVPAPLATPFPLTGLGAITTKKFKGLRKRMAKQRRWATVEA